MRGTVAGMSSDGRVASIVLARNCVGGGKSGSAKSLKAAAAGGRAGPGCNTIKPRRLRCSTSTPTLSPNRSTRSAIDRLPLNNTMT